MTTVQQGQLLASLIWLAILLGPPLVLTFLAPMVYVDGAAAGPNTRPVHADNRAALVLLAISLCTWVLLLKYVYLPLIGFDREFLTIGGLVHQDYSDPATLRTFWLLTTTWVTQAPAMALLLLAFPVLLGGAVLVFARALGRSASLPARAHAHGR